MSFKSLKEGEQYSFRHWLAIKFLRLASLLDDDVVRIRMRYAYPSLESVDPEFGSVKANYAVQKLLKEYQFDTVLDVGAGSGDHSAIFVKHGKSVTLLDKGSSVYFKRSFNQSEFVVSDFLDFRPECKFDLVWCCHVLEHQTEPMRFIKLLLDCVKDGGLLCITVPPPKKDIVSGHVTMWNAGLLLYWLVLAGADCRGARVASSGYNISVILTKDLISHRLPDLDMDQGDIEKISKYLPRELKYGKNSNGDLSFSGEILSINW